MIGSVLQFAFNFFLRVFYECWWASKPFLELRWFRHGSDPGGEENMNLCPIHVDYTQIMYWTEEKQGR